MIKYKDNLLVKFFFGDVPGDVGVDKRPQKINLLKKCWRKTASGCKNCII